MGFLLTKIHNTQRGKKRELYQSIFKNTVLWKNYDFIFVVFVSKKNQISRNKF